MPFSWTRTQTWWGSPRPWAWQMLTVLLPLGLIVGAAILHLGPLDPGETFLDVGLSGAHYWAIGLGSAWAVLTVLRGTPGFRTLVVLSFVAMLLDVRTVITQVVHPLIAGTGLYHLWWPHDPVRAATVNALMSWVVLAVPLGLGLLASTAWPRTRRFHRFFAGFFLLSVLSTHVLFHIVTIQAMRDRGDVEVGHLESLSRLDDAAFFAACDAQRLHCGLIRPDGQPGAQNPSPGDGVTLEPWRWASMASLAASVPPATPANGRFAMRVKSDVARGPHGEVLGAFVMATRGADGRARLVVDTVLATRLRHRAERRFEALGAAQAVTWLTLCLGAALFHGTLRERRRAGRPSER